MTNQNQPEKDSDAHLQSTQEIIDRFHQQVDADHIYALVSGGGDSDTACDVAQRFGLDLSGIVHVNTGIGIEETRRYVMDRCLDWDLPFHELTSLSDADSKRFNDGVSRQERTTTPEDTVGVNIAPNPYQHLNSNYYGVRRDNDDYEKMVRKMGFPGPSMHWIMYLALKHKPIKNFVKHHHDEDETVAFVSGVRQKESDRRAKNMSDDGLSENWGECPVVSPLAEWSESDVTSYRVEHDLPSNPVSDILGMSGECLCLDPDTLISTEDGWEPITDVDEGDKVHSLQDGETELTEVMEKHVQDSVDMVKINPYYRPGITATENHPIYARPYEFVYDDNWHYEQSIDEPEWVDAGKIVKKTRNSVDAGLIDKERFYIGAPFRTEESPVDLTDNELQFIGYFVAEGCFQWRPQRDSESHGVVFILSRKSRDLAENIRDSFNSCFPDIEMNIEETEDPRDGQEYYRLRTGEPEVSQFVEQWVNGRYSNELELDQRLMTATLEQQKKLLDAMWMGDGSEYDRERKSENRSDENISAYSTTSKKLALQVQEVLLRSGKVYGINHSSNNSYLVRKTVGEPEYGFIKDDILWCLVQDVEEVGANERHNLTVRDQPNYITETGLVHNCGAFGSREEIEQLKRWGYDDTARQIESLEFEVFQKQVSKGYVEQEYALWGHGNSKTVEEYENKDTPQMLLCADCDDSCDPAIMEESGSTTKAEAALKEDAHCEIFDRWFFCPECQTIFDDPIAHRRTVHAIEPGTPYLDSIRWDVRELSIDSFSTDMETPVTTDPELTNADRMKEPISQTLTDPSHTCEFSATGTDGISQCTGCQKFQIQPGEPLTSMITDATDGEPVENLIELEAGVLTSIIPNPHIDEMQVVTSVDDLYTAVTVDEVTSLLIERVNSITEYLATDPSFDRLIKDAGLDVFLEKFDIEASDLVDPKYESNILNKLETEANDEDEDDAVSPLQPEYDPEQQSITEFTSQP